MKRALLFLILGTSGCQAVLPPPLPGRLAAPQFSMEALAEAAGAVTAAAPEASLRGPAPPPISGTTGDSGGSSAAAGSVPAGAAPAVPAAVAPVGDSFGGQVWGAGSPLADAKVQLADGREAVTDATGRFRFAGVAPADGAYVVSHGAFYPSSVIGLTGNDVALHLVSRLAAPGEHEPAVSRQTIVTTGRLVDENGQGVESVQVVARDARGSYGAAVSEADGTFRLELEAVDGEFVQGSLLAVDNKGGNRMGQLVDVTLGDQGVLPTLALRPATHAVRFVLDASQAPGPLTCTLDVRGPNGETVSLATETDTLRLAPLPQLSFGMRAVVQDNASRTSSELRRASVPLALSQTDTVLTGALMAPPTLPMHLTLQQGTPLSWPEVAGAKGYQLTLAGWEGQGLTWQAFTPSAGMPFNYPGLLGVGLYVLNVTAWDYADLSPRHVASLRALRFLNFPAGDTYRRASRQSFASRP